MVMLIDVKLYTKQLSEVTWYQIKCNGYLYQVVEMLFNVK
jgi:hypothetical protein